eukprot:2248201-Pyramimonas_sp.AAC.1
MSVIALAQSAALPDEALTARPFCGLRFPEDADARGRRFLSALVVRLERSRERSRELGQAFHSSIIVQLVL